MTFSMFMMYVSFAGMFFLILAIALIVFSRRKLKGWLAGIVSMLAYISLILGALIIMTVVLNGPTPV